ncbi:MAG: RrF2 family transcriptional regulator [Solirubrobacterales bacterium]
MRLSAKVDYAVRATLVLADAWGEGPVKAGTIAHSQRIPIRFLENILMDLRRAGLVRSRRGADGGYELARAPGEITIADVMRVEQGNLADIHGDRPEDVDYDEAAEHLRDVWVAARSAYRAVLEQVTLADVVGGELPRQVAALADDADAWRSWPQR